MSAVGPFRSLLVPVDLSPGADRVLGRVSLLPLADDARVTLLHVVPGNLPPRERRLAERDATRALVAEARHLRKQIQRNVEIETLVTSGTTAKVIAACATEKKAELIVMGRRGERALRDVFLGSTAERVIRQARLPVLVVRLAPRASYARPALALDLDEAAHEAVRLMLRVLPPPRPRVEVIHAFIDPYRRLSYPSLPEDEAEERRAELQAEATREVSNLLSKALAKVNVPSQDAPLKLQVRCGPPQLVVEKVVRSSGTDLLVLGTHGHSGAAYLFLGTVAGNLLRAAGCDVLVVPPAPARR